MNRSSFPSAGERLARACRPAPHADLGGSSPQGSAPVPQPQQACGFPPRGSFGCLHTATLGPRGHAVASRRRSARRLARQLPRAEACRDDPSGCFKLLPGHLWTASEAVRRLGATLDRETTCKQAAHGPRRRAAAGDPTRPRGHSSSHQPAPPRPWAADRLPPRATAQSQRLASRGSPALPAQRASARPASALGPRATCRALVRVGIGEVRRRGRAQCGFRERQSRSAEGGLGSGEGLRRRGAPEAGAVRFWPGPRGAGPVACLARARSCKGQPRPARGAPGCGRLVHKDCVPQRAKRGGFICFGDFCLFFGFAAARALRSPSGWWPGFGSPPAPPLPGSKLRPLRSESGLFSGPSCLCALRHAASHRCSSCKLVTARRVRAGAVQDRSTLTRSLKAPASSDRARPRPAAQLPPVGLDSEGSRKARVVT